MKNKIISFLVVWITVLIGSLFAQDYLWEDVSRGNHDAQALLVSPQDSKFIFAGVAGSVLKSNDSGKSWRRVLAIRSRPNNINSFVFDFLNLNMIFVATDNGLYRSKDLGEHWERVFRGKNSAEDQCTAVLVGPDVILIGTKAGLFISRDNARSWKKENSVINNTVVLNIDASIKLSKNIYLATSGAIYKSQDSGETWERCFVSYAKESKQEDVVSTEETVEAENLTGVCFVKADINNLNCVYFSSTKGVYKSLDQGNTWNKLSEYGLLNRDVKMLCLSSDSRIFGLTQTGVFFYKNERWVETSFDLAAGKLNYLILDNKGDIYVAAEKGIFKSSQRNFQDISGRALLREYLKYEPKIADVQKAAIKYAEVNPEKISQWREKAAKKAILPHISIGLDSNSTDLWHWETGSTTKNDDDALRRGKQSIDWDVALSWDLGELIWNDAQASIDVRSKLMVQYMNWNISMIVI